MTYQPRRIVHLISRLDGYGGARMLRHLAISGAAAGDDVTVLALNGADAVDRELRDAGVAVIVIGSRGAFDPVAAVRIARSIRRRRADVVHAWDAEALVHAALQQRSTGCKVIAAIDAAQTRLPWSARVLRCLRHRVYHFVAAEEATVAWLHGQGVQPAQISLIPRATPPQICDGLPPAELARLDLPADARVIAVAGPLVRRRRLDESIWCFELVRVLYPNARLLIFGDGPDRPRLERFAHGVSEPGCIHFFGYRYDLGDWLPRAELFWQLEASLATPYALLEAQAVGVPIVASDVPAHRCVVAEGRTGRLVALGNRASTARATDDLFADPSTARSLAAAGGVEIAQAQTFDAAMSAYDHLYDRLIGRPSK